MAANRSNAEVFRLKPFRQAKVFENLISMSVWRNGRRARLRGVWRNLWGFKSPHRHQKDQGYPWSFCYQGELELYFVCWTKYRVQPINRHTFAVRLELHTLAYAQAKSPHRHPFKNHFQYLQKKTSHFFMFLGKFFKLC